MAPVRAATAAAGALGRHLPAAALLFSRSASSGPAIASKLLDTTKLKPGDVLVQNEGDSEAAKAVIAAAKDRGVMTVSVIGDKPGSADIIEQLKVAGADVVVTESYCNTWFAQRLLSDLPTPAVGVLHNPASTPALAVARLLGKGSTLVTYDGAKLPSSVEYAGAIRKPKKWADYLKEKGITAKSL